MASRKYQEWERELGRMLGDLVRIVRADEIARTGVWIAVLRAVTLPESLVAWAKASLREAGMVPQVDAFTELLKDGTRLWLILGTPGGVA